MALAIAQINFSALKHNLQQVKKRAPHSKVMAVLKANAYGHGLVPIAQQLSAADAFAVARIDEALALRAGGVTKPIVLLEGFFQPTDLAIMLANNFQTIIHDITQLEALENAQLDGQIATWLKVDTGMRRLGIEPSEFEHFYQRLKHCKNAKNTVNLMTHFACADEPNNAKVQAQLQGFHTLTQSKQEPLCLANSAAILAYPQSHADWVRPGLMLYGVSPLQNQQGAELQLQGVMELLTQVIAIKKIKKGESVGYGAHWQASEDTTLAVVAMGYGDGYPRNVKPATPVLINNQRYPQVGRVSMDMITVDIGNNSQNIKVGDQVVMWGGKLPVEEIAQCADTIPYELLCNITPRVSYRYME